MNTMYWRKEFSRAKRLFRMPHSERRFYNIMGRFWLLRHGFVREYKVYYGRSKHQFYCLDLSVPRRKLYIEVDSRRWHKPGNHNDVVKDFVLKRAGWTGIRVTSDDMRNEKGTRKYVRQFIKDPAKFYRKYQ